MKRLFNLRKGAFRVVVPQVCDRMVFAHPSRADAGVDARTTAGPETGATKQNRPETERSIGLDCAINGALRPWFGCVVETAKTTACGLIASELPW
jgi:hypothetical protein